MHWSAAFAAESWAQEINLTTRDVQEGLRAFAERRAPHFDGRRPSPLTAGRFQ